MDKDSSTSPQNQPISTKGASAGGDNDKPKRKCTAADFCGSRLKRACTEKQLAALRAGRAKNSRFKPKSTDVKTSKDSQ